MLLSNPSESRSRAQAEKRVAVTSEPERIVGCENGSFFW